jgi:hypothetical protein
MKRPHVSAEQLVRAWQTAATADEAAKVTGMPVKQLRQRAAVLRSKGVPLKKFPRLPGSGHPPLDIAALTKLARDLVTEPREATEPTPTKKPATQAERRALIAQKAMGRPAPAKANVPARTGGPQSF